RLASPRVLMLTARLPQAHLLAGYLDAAIQTVHRRPVELRLGVLNGGRFHFREYNSAEVGDEIFPWDDRLPESERPLALLDALIERGEQILVFCPSKADCHRRAEALAARRPSGGTLTEDDRWQLQSGPSLAGVLAEWLVRSVAVHHADLTPHQRTLIESLFCTGRVAVVFCTGTLAWGVNLPATTVFIDAEKYTGGPCGGRPIPVPLDRLEFEGMAGRAGRLGLGATGHHPISRGILWGRTACEADLLWNAYIAPPKSQSVRTPSDTAADHTQATCELKGEVGDSPPPAFAPARRLLDWIVAGLVHSLDEAQALAQRSPFGINDPSVWEPACARLLATALIQRDADGQLVATPRGSITATAGLTIDSAIAIERALAACSDFDAAVWSAFFATLPETADARLTGWALSAAGTDQIAAFWHTRFGENFTETIARRFAADPGVITIHFPNAAAQARAMLTALVLDDWAAGTPTRDLEHRYRLPIGRLEPVADTLSWIFETAALLAKTVTDAQRFAADLKRAAFEIRHGIRSDAAPLVGALEGLLPRQTLLDLIAGSFGDPGELCRRRAVDLAGLAPLPVIERVLARCRAWVKREAERAQIENCQSPEVNQPDTRPPGHYSQDTREASMSPILHLDGGACRARLSVQLAGRTLMLRAKSFKYLLALAAARLLSRDGWILKTDIEPGENQIKYLYQLRRELGEAGQPADGLIENDGNGRYRLTLPPQAIRFDLPRLLEHPDWDIRARAEQLTAATAA
ncbi:MAG TPA: helicase-related protein, partial [Acidobacteriota bacterium]|nr:helicase-related protein [Acidobacteriota bacterium]